MHLELDSRRRVGVEELERPPVERDQGADALLPTIACGAAAKAQQPADEGRIQRGANRERPAPAEHAAESFADDSRARKGIGEARADPARVAPGCPRSGGAALEDDSLGARAVELVGAAEADNASSYHRHPHGSLR